MRQDLNDLYYFVKVVDHGGFAQAGRVLGMPKSKLSRRIALLEGRLGVQLIQRSTRSFSVTEVGQAYYTRCNAMLVEADAAQMLIDSTHAEPCGTVHLSCPIALLHACVGPMLVAFADKFPALRIELVGMNRVVNLLAEGLDLAIRVESHPSHVGALTVRTLGHATQYLVASPSLSNQFGMPSSPADLASWPSLGYGPPAEHHIWDLSNSDGSQVTQQYTPRFVTTDMATLCHAAVTGIGVVQLPLMVVRDELANKRLIRLLPDWTLRPKLIQVAFPTRRELIPSVRLLLDHLVEKFANMNESRAQGTSSTSSVRVPL
ncbi:MAG: LysR family transcriptional regulator [Nitrospira sp.]|nr:LysR family transcriptional regulator [Nitrospira sp.]